MRTVGGSAIAIPVCKHSSSNSESNSGVAASGGVILSAADADGVILPSAQSRTDLIEFFLKLRARERPYN